LVCRSERPGEQGHGVDSGVNWYLTQNVEWVLDYTATRFDGGAKDGKDRADEKAFFTRFQVAF